MEIKFTAKDLKKLEEIKKRYPTSEACVMHALWMAQYQYGWISEDVMKYIADILKIPYENVYGVVSFYTMYNKKPVGKHLLQVCTNVSCMLRGGYEITDYISKKLNVNIGETTADGKFTLIEAECLGSCGTAPMMQVNDYYKENLTKENVDAILDELSKH